MSFTDAEEDKMISRVAQYPVLYDSSNKKYPNTDLKDKIWKNIGRDLNKSSEDCKRKWKSIRDSYMRFKKNTKVGSAAAKKSKQNRHLLLSFLDNVPHPRANVTGLPVALDDYNENDSVDEQTQDTVLSSNFYYTQQNPTDLEVEVAAELTEVAPKVKEARTLKKKKTEDMFLKTWKQRDQRRQKLYKNIAKRKDDEIDLFCRHIGEVLRKLPPYDKAKAKKHLGQVLSDYEIMAASHSAVGTSTSLSHYDPGTGPSGATGPEVDVDVPGSVHYMSYASYSPTATEGVSPGPTV